MPREEVGLDRLLVALRGARDALAESAQVLDALNVFPVPDGDTGRNLLYTLAGGIDALEREPPSTLGALAEHLGSSFVRDSRGNSGFLISAFFDAFLEHLAAAGAFDRPAFAEAFETGAETARKALAKPREGTLLTASAYMADALRFSAARSLEELLGDAIVAGHDAVRETPALLPLLRRAGVVDAGALGFVRIFEGMRAALLGSTLEPLVESEHRFEPAGDPQRDPAPLTHPFCTQLLVERRQARSIDQLRSWLERHGESVVVHERAGRIRLHVHSDQPDEVVRHAARWGQVVERRVEDMRDQIAAAARSAPSITPVEGRVAVLAVVPGRGFGALFGELGVDGILDYDLELPSVDQLVRAVEAIDARAVILLPNDLNLIAAAGRSGALLADQTVGVVPTASPVAGVAAMYGYDPTGALQVNLDEMSRSRLLVDAMALHRSVRDVVFGGLAIHDGDHFVLAGEEVLAATASLLDAVAAAVATRDLRRFSSLTLYHGRELEAAAAAALRKELGERFPDLELRCVEGGQRRPLLWLAFE